MIPCDSTGLWAGGLISGSTVTILGRPLGIVAVEREPLTPAGGYIITLDPNYAIDPLGLTWSVQGQDLVVATVAFPLSDTQLLVETAFGPGLVLTDCTFFVSCFRLGVG